MLRDIDFWLKAGPTLAAVIVPLLTYLWLARRMARYQTQLNKDIERYKIDLSKELESYKANITKELESHKLQLQSAFQIKFYEFQTRYSLLHQQRAEAIVKLFKLLARVEMDLQNWANWDVLRRTDTKEEFYAKTQERFQEAIEFHDENRIYFDDEITKSVQSLVRTTELLFSNHYTIEVAANSHPALAEDLKQQARRIVEQNVIPIMKQLQGKIRILLSPEQPNLKNSNSLKSGSR